MCDFPSLGSMLLCCGGKGGDTKDPYEAHHFHIQEPGSLKQPATRHRGTEIDFLVCCFIGLPFFASSQLAFIVVVDLN